jgi:hypothetical protein
MPFATIDLAQPREKRNEELAACIFQYANDKKLPMDQVVTMILNDVLGNELVDDELEESLVISLAGTFGCDTKNPEHEINGGEDEDDDE